MRPSRPRRCRSCRALLDMDDPLCRDHGFCDRKCSENYWEKHK